MDVLVTRVNGQALGAAVEYCRGVSRLAIGQRVRITRGALAGMTGRIVDAEIFSWVVKPDALTNGVRLVLLADHLEPIDGLAILSGATCDENVQGNAGHVWADGHRSD